MQQIFCDICGQRTDNEKKHVPVDVTKMLELARIEDVCERCEGKLNDGIDWGKIISLGLLNEMGVERESEGQA